jgi:ribonucleoside-diphosphate reductase alpha chain
MYKEIIFMSRSYTEQEVRSATLKYFNGDDLATNAWMSKYALKEGDDYLELTPDNMHKRMAKEFARIENNYPNPQFTEQEIYELFKDFKYIIPQGRVMAGLGVKNSYRSLSNCLVLPSPLDSYSSIMYTDTMFS